MIGKRFQVILLLALGLSSCGSDSQPEAGQYRIDSTFKLVEEDSALLAAMDAAHAEFGPYVSDSLGGDGPSQTSTGTFMELQGEQNPKFVFKDESGKVWSLSLKPGLPEGQWAPYREGRMQGTKVRVEWERPNSQKEEGFVTRITSL